MVAIWGGPPFRLRTVVSSEIRFRAGILSVVRSENSADRGCVLRIPISPSIGAEFVGRQGESLGLYL